MSFASRFLAQPDSFRSHVDGEPWGQCSVCLDIGGTTPVFGLSEQQQAAIVARFGAGVAGESENAGGTFSIHVRRLGRAAFNEFDRRGWINTLDIGHEPDAVPLAGYGFAGNVRLAGDRSAVLWTAEDRDAEFLNLFENFFRVLVAYRALSQGGVLLHSSGLLCGTGALVFYGHSGAGKSTLAEERTPTSPLH